MNAIDSLIAESLGSAPARSQPAGGGCIHNARRLELADGRMVFVKTAGGDLAEVLAAETRGIRLLEPHIRVPAIISEGETNDGFRWLALEWLDLLPLGSAAWEDLGRQLAALHSVTADRHGLDHDNFIGATPQSNRPADSWCGFYLESRLRPQLRLARSHGHDLPEPEILGLAEKFLADHDPPPALLHGDLWSGNAAGLANSRAVVFDPAPYHGDPETDLAMLELFGGPLPETFLKNYGTLSPDRPRRRPLYDLYHALNHLNLFGPGYLPMLRRCLDALNTTK